MSKEETRITHKAFINAQEKLLSDEKSEHKSRIFRELVLGVICILSFLYSRDVSAGSSELSSSEIDIPVLSIKLPLDVSIPFFPSILLVGYIVLMSSIETLIAIRRKQFSIIYKYRKIFPSEEDLLSQERSLRFGNVFLPAAIRFDAISVVSSSGLAAWLRLIALMFIVVVYTVLPYYVAIYTTIASYKLNHSKLFISWNVICILLMLSYLLSILLGASRRRIYVLWEKDGEFSQPYVSQLLYRPEDHNT